MANAEISGGSVLIDSGSWLILDWFLIGSGNVSLFLACLCSVGAHALYGYGRPCPCPNGIKGVLALPCGPMACWAKGIFCQLGLLSLVPTKEVKLCPYEVCPHEWMTDTTFFVGLF